MTKLALLLLLSSCTYFVQRTNYGMLSNQDLKEGKLKLSDTKKEDKRCLYMILAFIPAGSFSNHKVEDKLELMLEKDKGEVALANVTQETYFRTLIPFYYAICTKLRGTPLIYEKKP